MKTNQNHQRKDNQEMLSKVYATIGQRWLDNERTQYMPVAKAIKTLNITLSEIYSDIQIDCFEDKAHSVDYAYKDFFKLIIKTRKCKKTELKRFVAAAFCASSILDCFEIKELR